MKKLKSSFFSFLFLSSSLGFSQVMPFSFYQSKINTSNLVTNSLIVNLDAGNTSSYPGNGITWTDLSGNGNHGTLFNGVAFNSSNGGSLVFDGVNDYADITSNSFGSATILTIEGFVKWVSGSGGMFFGFTTYDVWTESGTLGYNTGGGNVVGISAAIVSNLNLVGNWHHYTFVMKSSGLLSTNKIYIDGVDVGVLTPVVRTDANIPGFNNNLRLCSWNNGGFLGNMQYGNLRIYNRELTASEIQQNYNVLKSRFGM
ncbi:LamG domain-containing protein [Pedobacter aquae]|uniref:LamG domain-containing protein n=1 Tax=Pedobacter aquae TaxID=2605747 RepID=A0A5C0VHY2_9SPHI|nr:LamG-like jellyroll fold domain-containing protein [Pedobacter aquae]QEK52308.1 LamG domain-containing protein [Pedobacter aquae]